MRAPEVRPATMRRCRMTKIATIGRHVDRGIGHDPVPVGGVRSEEARQADAGRLVGLSRDDRLGIDVFAEGLHEGEDGEHQDAVARQRQDDEEERAPAGIAVDQRRLLQLARHVHEGGADEDDVERDRLGRRGEDHRRARIVQQADLVEADIERRDHHRGRQHLQHQDAEQADVDPGAAVAGEHVGAAGAEQHRQRGDAGADDEEFHRNIPIVRRCHVSG